jgi:DNA-binding phage protein
MTLARDFRKTLAERLGTDPGLAKAMLAEAANAFLNGDAAAARLILRDLVDSSINYGPLGAEVGCQSERLRHMLSRMGNPSMNDLAIIFVTIGKQLGVVIETHTVEAT